jgi:hypothetical protein
MEFEDCQPRTQFPACEVSYVEKREQRELDRGGIEEKEIGENRRGRGKYLLL